jgi:hypothetical protein
MAWPPPVLPTNRTNATPQQDTHPADHNAVNLAVNDLVTHVQAYGPGATSTSGWGISGTYYGTPGGTPLRLLSKNQNFTTDASGDFILVPLADYAGGGILNACITGNDIYPAVFALRNQSGNLVARASTAGVDRPNTVFAVQALVWVW